MKHCKLAIIKLCTLSILMSSLVSTGVPSAFAKDLNSHVKIEKNDNSKFSLIRRQMAQFSLEEERGESRIKTITEMTLALKEAGVTVEDLQAFAVSDLNPVEAKAVNDRIANLKANKGEFSDLIGSLALSQSSGSHFLDCAVGWTIVGAGVLTFFIAGAMLIDADSKISDKKKNIKDLQLKSVNLQSEINILRTEGVSGNSYLVTSRQADLDYINAQISQETTDKEQYKKNAMTLGIITGVGVVSGAVAAIVGTDCGY